MPIRPTEIQFKEFLSNHTSVCQWLIEKHIDGIWYSSWDKPQDFWLNDDFHSLFDFTSGKLSKEDPLFREYINSHSDAIIEKLITAAVEDPQKKHQATIIFNDQLNKEIRLLAEIKTVCEQGIVLKFKNLKVEKEATDSQLREELENLKKLTSVYNETNEIARIGGWDVDLVKNSIKWTNVTCDIHELGRDYIPDLETGISFYKEGWSRDLITKLFGEAVEKGQPFDDEFKLVTAKGNEIWVRSFGKPEFKDGKCIRVFGAFQDIDQQKKRQIELKDAKDRFESIFDNSPVGTLLFDLSDNIVAINPSSRNMLGFENFSEEEISSLSFEDFIKPESLKTFGKHKSNLQKGVNKKDKVEIACTHVSGRTIWCNMISSLMPGRKDEGKLVITKIQDITQQKELQRLASENANKFIKAFENSPNGMCVVSTDGSWVMINKNLSQMMGYKAQELRNLSLKNITHPDDLHKDIILKRKLLSKEIEHYKLDKRFIHKNGRIVICQLHVSAIYDGDGVVTSFINQMVDMTHNHRVQRKLKHSLSDFQGLLDATTQIIIIETNRNHIIRKFNKGAERMLGYSANEVVGKKSPGIFHLPHEIEARKQKLFEENNILVENNEVFTFNILNDATETQEWTYRRKDGSKFTAQLRISEVRNQNDTVTGYLGIATDISQLKTMEESLINAKERAESANESKSEFLANMSHEIRTPLNGVIGFTDLLMRTELNESQKNYMQTVYNSANSLLDLINDILDFSKIEAGKLEINGERVDIIKLCEQTIDLFRHQAHAKELEILLNITPTLERYIWADGLRLKQIMMNLIGNAIKFTQKGEIEFKIAADESIEKTGFKTFTFSVRDTGIGIAPQNLDKIFYAFDQEDASTTRRFGGSGLGLTISNRLLEFMGSKLKVESTVDSGSVFYFDVEFKTDPLGSDQNKDIREINKVLVVDDNINNRDILKEMLASVGIETQQASNGIEAMDVLEKENDYDLAIIDYHMPYLNGLELIKYIREDLNIAKEQLPILLLHSSGEDDLIHRKCRDYEVQFFRTKPIHMSDLFNLINQIGNPGSMKKIEELLAPAPQTDLTAYAFKIMVAEDNPVNKHLTRTILQKIMPDVELIEVNNGQEAVDAYKERTIDLILMDIQMPILSGFEATTQIRALQKEMGREAIPIIALTAKTVKGERERCTSYGLDDYVTKPVILQTLKNVISLHLANRIDGPQQYSNQN